MSNNSNAKSQTVPKRMQNGKVIPAKVPRPTPTPNNK